MPEISHKVEEFRERVRSKYPQRKEPNFRIPWYVLVVNMLLIAYILFIYGRRPTDDECGTIIHYGGAEYQLAILSDASTGEKIASLTIRNLINARNTLTFRNNPANIEFYHGKTLVASEKIGDGITSLVFDTGEIRTFIVPIPLQKLAEYAKTNRDRTAKKRRSLITLEPEYFPFSARLTIYTASPVVSIFDYKLFGVK
jgi:hypothetical protein